MRRMCHCGWGKASHLTRPDNERASTNHHEGLGLLHHICGEQQIDERIRQSIFVDHCGWVIGVFFVSMSIWLQISIYRKEYAISHCLRYHLIVSQPLGYRNRCDRALQIIEICSVPDKQDYLIHYCRNDWVRYWAATARCRVYRLPRPSGKVNSIFPAQKGNTVAARILSGRASFSCLCPLKAENLPGFYLA